MGKSRRHHQRRNTMGRLEDSKAQRTSRQPPDRFRQDLLGAQGLDARATDMTPVTMANSPIDLTSQTLLVEQIIERVEELEQFGTEAGSMLAEWQAAERAKLEGLL